MLFHGVLGIPWEVPVKSSDTISIAKIYLLLHSAENFSSACPKQGLPQTASFYFVSHRCHLKGFLQHLRGTPWATWLTGLVKDRLFFLRMMFQIVFCFCHILFSYPNQYSQSACRFYMPRLVIFFLLFCPEHQGLFFPFCLSIMCVWGLLRW